MYMGPANPMKANPAPIKKSKQPQSVMNRPLHDENKNNQSQSAKDENLHLPFEQQESSRRDNAGNTVIGVATRDDIVCFRSLNHSCEKMNWWFGM